MDPINKLFVNNIVQRAQSPAKKQVEEDKRPEPQEPQSEFSDSKALSLAELIGRTTISMQQKKKTFTAMTAQHILVKEEKEAIELKKELDICKTPEEKAAKFLELAKKHSKCPSGKEGGSLGEFKKGQMVSEFENAASEANIGEISAPVKTQFGWHLIKVNERK